MILKITIIVLLLATLVSLGIGLFYLATDHGHATRRDNLLGWTAIFIALGLVLFLMAFSYGWIA